MKEKVYCSDCGFLCWDVSDYRDPISKTIKWGEVFSHNRKELAEGKIKAIDDDTELNESYRLSCLKHQWIWLPNNKNPRHNFVGMDELKAPKTCEYYFKYVPGSGPEEHKQLNSEWRLRNVTWHAALLGAGVGAAGAIAAQLIYMLLTKGN